MENCFTRSSNEGPETCGVFCWGGFSYQRFRWYCTGGCSEDCKCLLYIIESSCKVGQKYVRYLEKWKCHIIFLIFLFESYFMLIVYPVKLVCQVYFPWLKSTFHGFVGKRNLKFIYSFCKNQKIVYDWKLLRIEWEIFK